MRDEARARLSRSLVQAVDLFLAAGPSRLSAHRERMTSQTNERGAAIGEWRRVADVDPGAGTDSTHQWRQCEPDGGHVGQWDLPRPTPEEL
jgi:hypothetical protein